jgi:tRNA pseudouridine55 synthase
VSVVTRAETALGEGALFKLDKPAGPTSHDVVHAVRRHLGVRRVGHAGTLDPPATGLLVVGVGPATRVLSWVSACDKVYRGRLALGTATDTMDAAGRVVERREWARDAEVWRRAAAGLVGPGVQRPPMVSAVRVAGERLYRLAARGRMVERPPRPIHIRRLTPLAFDLEAGWIDFEVECSSGTYVRALAHDWGERAGSAAHLAELRRLSVGRVSVEGAYPAERLAPRGHHPAGEGARRTDLPPGGWRDLESARLSWDEALAYLGSRRLTPAEEAALVFGRAPRSLGERGTLRLESAGGRLLGVSREAPAGLPLELACVLVRPEPSP